jgi:hypothetical protein
MPAQIADTLTTVTISTPTAAAGVTCTRAVSSVSTAADDAASASARGSASSTNALK